jgi:pimeloyl-ACP methyl ester carboxylesterase
MEPTDDDLTRFELEGAAALPVPNEHGTVENEGARIWYATYRAGRSLILLHGGLGTGGNWINQLPALLGSGSQAVLTDSRGYGRSTRDGRPYTYDQMTSDVSAVMDG